MKLRGIRSRILLAAMLPVTLIVLLLVTAFLVTRLGDNQEDYRHHARALVRQLAASCEYGLFSGNSANLQSIAHSALRESDLRSILILGADGELLAKAGVPGYQVPSSLGQAEAQQHDASKGTDLFLQAITASPLPLDDLFEAKASAAAVAPKYLGHVLIEVSKDKLQQRERELLWFGFGLALIGLLLGGLLALRLSEGVIAPVARVSRMIERIRRGELDARAEVSSDDPLRDLQQGLNQMARSLESSRHELERRVAMATLALREKKEEAETATLAKSRFLAAASHDLRQPTHALGMFVARLKQLEHKPEALHLIAHLELSLLAMRDLLDGLLDISRLEAGTVQVRLQSFHLNDVFEQLKVELGLTAIGRGLTLRIRPSSLGLRSDPTLLHQILLNLMANALRYTELGGVLLAGRRAADGKSARIEVWDSGIGIALEHQEAIFKEFYQIGNLERDRGKGLGLGLNIVQRTAQLLGHRLHVCSRPGVGSRFSVEVPLAPAPAVALERSNVSPTDSYDNLQGLTVQVIEDDELAREGMVGLLASWGIKVVAAGDLSTALRQLNAGSLPDLILSDYRLPQGEDGIAAVRQLRAAAGWSIPAFLISGDTDPGLLLAARDAGLILLHKPVRPAKMRNLIRRLTNTGQTD